MPHCPPLQHAMADLSPSFLQHSLPSAQQPAFAHAAMAFLSPFMHALPFFPEQQDIPFPSLAAICAQQDFPSFASAIFWQQGHAVFVVLCAFASGVFGVDVCAQGRTVRARIIANILSDFIVVSPYECFSNSLPGKARFQNQTGNTKAGLNTEDHVQQRSEQKRSGMEGGDGTRPHQRRSWLC